MKGQVHTCTICGFAGLWDENWTWFGSYDQLENGESIIKSCSDKCWRSAFAKTMIDKSVAEQIKILLTTLNNEIIVGGFNRAATR